MNEIEQPNEILVTWDEVGYFHRVRGLLKNEDETFLTVRLENGTELRIAKKAILKVETPAEAIHRILTEGEPR
jgi:hypothetical protein